MYWIYLNRKLVESFAYMADVNLWIKNENMRQHKINCFMEIKVIYKLTTIPKSHI
jgi:hypothetical protein